MFFKRASVRAVVKVLGLGLVLVERIQGEEQSKSNIGIMFGLG
jgi:hypothetical protein